MKEEQEKHEEKAGEENAQLKKGLSQSRKILISPFKKASLKKVVDSSFWSDMTEALILADAGAACAEEIVDAAKRKVIKEGIRDLDGIIGAFEQVICEAMQPITPPSESQQAKPQVIFVVGVNGVGKTTTAAKIGYWLKKEGKRVLFAAADTFRAAGIEQMERWAERVGAPVVRHKQGGDPAAVVYDALESAIARGIDALIVDTAGRLHTKKNLMAELSKMWRVAQGKIEGKPEGILVIDATTGQNGISQAKLFSEALEVDSIALTKMDGSAKGGIVLTIGKQLGIPVKFVGVGEGLDDLKPFDPLQYARALI
ncbi:MAG: signal recognition particle-docking protein FtsY [Actinomycetota bacterium]|nr:signal recognition particle-docking protein FtsY [Actinomycetota bacterium]